MPPIVTTRSFFFSAFEQRPVGGLLSPLGANHEEIEQDHQRDRRRAGRHAPSPAALGVPLGRRRGRLRHEPTEQDTIAKHDSVMFRRQDAAVAAPKSPSTQRAGGRKRPPLRSVRNNRVAGVTRHVEPPMLSGEPGAPAADRAAAKQRRILK